MVPPGPNRVKKFKKSLGVINLLEKYCILTGSMCSHARESIITECIKKTHNLFFY